VRRDILEEPLIINARLSKQERRAQALDMSVQAQVLNLLVAASSRPAVPM
jgi:ABC-type oligopeptide transport system ATPase subunit